MQHDDYRIATRAIHAGTPKERHFGAVVTPIYQSAMYLFGGQAEGEELRYIRYGNTPNQEQLAVKLAALETAEAAVVASSGMAAISNALLTVLGQGDHVLFQNCVYGGTHNMLVHEFPRLGIEYDFVDGEDPSSWKAALRPNTRAFYLESVSNPLMGVADLAAAASFAREHNLVSMVDNTFPSPIFFRPSEWGFDLSLHSGTKYLNGHSDIVAGAVIGRRELVDRVAARITRLGGALDPHACFLLNRGIQTLAIRMRQHTENATRVAQMLVEHSAVECVHYPGLKDFSGHERATHLFDGMGGMLSFELVGGADAAAEFLRKLRVFVTAPSLGGVESLASIPARASHAGMSPADRERIGISDGLVRLSIGIEDDDDLIADLDTALH